MRNSSGRRKPRTTGRGTRSTRRRRGGKWNTGDGGTEHDAEHETLDHSSRAPWNPTRAPGEEIAYDEGGKCGGGRDAGARRSRPRAPREAGGRRPPLEEEGGGERGAKKREIEKLEEENEAPKKESSSRRR